MSFTTAAPASMQPSGRLVVAPDLLRRIIDAVRTRRQVGGRRAGRALRLWPHALGWRRGDLWILGLILEAGQDPVARWEWIRVAEVEEPWVEEGMWIGSPPGYRPSSDFLEVVIAECDADDAA